MPIHRWKLSALCHHPDKFGDHRYWILDIMFSIYHLTSHDLMFKVLCKFMCGIFTVSCNLLIFCDNWSVASGDINYLICQVPSQNPPD